MKPAKMIFWTVIFATQGAFASPADINAIINLANQVRSAAQTTEASQSDLLLAKEKLREVIELLNNTGGSDGGYTRECFDFAFDAYQTSQTTSAATDSAIRACKLIQDLEIAKYLFEKHNSSLTSAAAMNKTANEAGAKLSGKLDLLEFAFENYNSSMTSSTAATRAATKLVNVRVGKLNCLQELFENYSSSMSSALAMDKSIEGCSR